MSPEAARWRRTWPPPCACCPGPDSAASTWTSCCCWPWCCCSAEARKRRRRRRGLLRWAGRWTLAPLLICIFCPETRARSERNKAFNIVIYTLQQYRCCKQYRYTRNQCFGFVFNWIQIWIQQKISIRIQKTLNPDPSYFFNTIWKYCNI